MKDDRISFHIKVLHCLQVISLLIFLSNLALLYFNYQGIRGECGEVVSDVEERRGKRSSEAEPQSDAQSNGVWLPSVSKVESDQLAEKCLAVHEYCTTSEGRGAQVGAPGRRGAVGPAGDQGPIGREGIIGPTGRRGHKGPRGPPGKAGKDIHCLDCPYPHLEMNRTQCPTAVPRHCPSGTPPTISAAITPSGYVNASSNAVLTEQILKLMENVDNTTEHQLEECFQMCVTNYTGYQFTRTPPITTTTEQAYIEGVTAHCLLQHIGKPVFHAHSRTYYGSWMRDSYPISGDDLHKRWLANHFYGNILYEFRDEADMRRDKHLVKYILPHGYDGTNHVFFNGSFYYHRAGTPRIAKFDTTNRSAYDEVEVDEFAAYRRDQYLYNMSYTYFDLAIDENSLWVMYHQENSPSLFAAQLDVNNLTIYDTWNLTQINHTGTEWGSARYSGVSEVIRAYDFFREKYYHRNPYERGISWINLYRQSNMISYNPFDQRIYVYDHGYLLTLPARRGWRVR